MLPLTLILNTPNEIFNNCDQVFDILIFLKNGARYPYRVSGSHNINSIFKCFLKYL